MVHGCKDRKQLPPYPIKFYRPFVMPQLQQFVMRNDLTPTITTLQHILYVTFFPSLRPKLWHHFL